MKVVEKIFKNSDFCRKISKHAKKFDEILLRFSVSRGFENFLVSHCFTLLGVQVLCSRRTALAGSSISSCAFIRIPGVSPAVEGANAAPLLLRDPLVQYLRLSVSLFVSPAFRRLRFVWRSAFRVQCLFVMCCIFSGIFRVVFPGFFPLGIPKVQRNANLVESDLENC